MSEPTPPSPTPPGAPAPDAPQSRSPSAEFTRIEASLRAQHPEAAADPRAAVSPPGLPLRMGLLVSLAVLAVAWHRTFVEMWLRWFPAWPRENLSLTKRLTEGDSYYSHGPLVPLTCLLLAYFIHRRVGLPIGRNASASRTGWLVMGLGLLAHLVAVYAGANFVSGFALIPVLAGLVLVWGGWPMARAYWLPVVMLVFMVPLPMSYIADLNFQLKSVAGQAALWLTNYVFKIPAVMSGSFVYLPNAPDGTPKMLVVENVCSGLRSLISLVWFGSLFAMICRVKGGWRWFLLVMAVPVAIACNIVRITGLNVVAHHHGVEAAGEGAAFHDMSGLLVFALALAIFFVLEGAISQLGSLLKRPWTDRKILGFLDRVPRPGVRPVGPPKFAVMTLGVAALLSLWFGRTLPEFNVSTQARNAVPTEVVIAGQAYTSRDLELDEKTLIILETNDYLYRRFTRKDDPKTYVDLLIVFSPNNRKGTHPPEVCLEGGGDLIVSKALHDVDADAAGVLSMRELVTQQQAWSNYHLYVYKCGRSYTPSFLLQQATIFANGVLSRNSSGALIRFTLPVTGSNVQASRELAVAAAEAVMPTIHERLP